MKVASENNIIQKLQIRHSVFLSFFSPSSVSLKYIDEIWYAKYNCPNRSAIRDQFQILIETDYAFGKVMSMD